MCSLLNLLFLLRSAVNDALFNEPSVTGGDSGIVLVSPALVPPPRPAFHNLSTRRRCTTCCQRLLHTIFTPKSAFWQRASVLPHLFLSRQVRDIEFASTCEQTLLPFHGRCHVAYVPASGVVLGLSKFARLTTLCARRLQSQQGLANDIIDALQVVFCFSIFGMHLGLCAVARQQCLDRWNCNMTLTLRFDQTDLPSAAHGPVSGRRSCDC